MPKPCQPDRPEVFVAGPSALRIAWSIPNIEPEISSCTVKVRIVGSKRFQNYDHSTGRLTAKGGSTVPAPMCEITAEGFEEGLEYEAFIAMMNSDGWGDISEPSLSTHIGDPKKREKPPAPSAPKLVPAGPGKLKCTWAIPDACPPVEATQVQITAVATGTKMLVDAANGKLVTSGRTTFAVSRLEANIVGVEDGVEYTAAICCRSAEGFGQYSMNGDPAEIVPQGLVSTGHQLVLHESSKHEEPVSGGPPVMIPMKEGKIKMRWVMPEEAKSITVKLRRIGDNNWYLCGGKAIAAPASETIATGLEEGLEYEATVNFLVNGKWVGESPLSKPGCIGEVKLPSIPGIPKEPRLFVLDQARGTMKLKWQTFTAVPAMTGIVVRFRTLGARSWQFVSPSTGEVVEQEPEPVPAPASEVDIVGLSAGVRYEAAVSFRNKLGTGPISPPSDPVCIGRPIPHLMKCTYCFNDFDLQHSEYTKSPETFYCGPCRFRQMDPFNAVVEPYGLLMNHTLVRGTVAFTLDLPDLKAWRKEDNDIFMRMVRIDSENCAQVWPRKLSFEANGSMVFEIKEPEEGHVRRDVPKNISAGLRPGQNTITIHIDDEYLAGFAMALVRTQTRTAFQIAQATPRCDEEAAKQRVILLLKDTWGTPDQNAEEEEEITCVISNKLKLRCPLSFERVVIPVRGETCMHLQCFGLGAYLESNMKMRALNNRWTCPVCGNLLKPHELRVDGYVERVLAETPAHIEEVLISEDGSFKSIEEAPAQAPVVKPAPDVKMQAADAGLADATAEDGEVTEMPQTIDDVDTASRLKRKRAADAALAPAERRRLRKKAMTVDHVSENDSN